MNFKRIISRKVYPTWVSTARLRGCIAYVFEVPKEQPFYHFQIFCRNDITFCSIAEGFTFETFEEACQAAEKWIKDNC